MTTTFETARDGDRVWCILHGWGEVRGTDASKTYPIAVSFHSDEIKTYTVDGFFDKQDSNRTLFWGEVMLAAPQKPRSDSAFPVEEKQISELRDQIAIEAMNGLLSNSGGVIQFNSMSGTGYANGDSEGVASWAYELADAMLKERSK